MKFSVSRLPSEAAGLDPDLAAAHPEQRVAGIALLEQHLADGQMLGVAKIGNPRQFVGTEIREHRIHLQNDRKFGLFAHGNACSVQNRPFRESYPEEVCHKSHNFTAGSDYF